jgi:hypothetical protein
MGVCRVPIILHPLETRGSMVKPTSKLVPKLNKNRRPKTNLTDERKQTIDKAFHECV